MLQQLMGGTQAAAEGNTGEEACDYGIMIGEPHHSDSGFSTTSHVRLLLGVDQKALFVRL
jgi:hypothetical protein